LIGISLLLAILIFIILFLFIHFLAGLKIIQMHLILQSCAVIRLCVFTHYVLGGIGQNLRHILCNVHRLISTTFLCRHHHILTPIEGIHHLLIRCWFNWLRLLHLFKNTQDHLSTTLILNQLFDNVLIFNFYVDGLI
jgi:hypothetical protein